MATKTFYLTATTSAEGWRTLNETPQAAVTNADGWVTGTGATLHSEYQWGVERAATTFVGTTVPTGTLDTALLLDAFQAGPFTGQFASGNWVFTFVVRAVTSAGGQNGRVRFRLIKANANGSSATEITAAQQQGSLVGLMSSSTTDYVSTLTMNPGAITLMNQYLFIQLAWERTVAGSMSTSDVNWRTGSSASVGTRIVTADFASGVFTTPMGGTAVTDSYAEVNANSGTDLSIAGRAFAQSFVGNGGFLRQCEFLLNKNLPTVVGTITAKVWATTGTHGTNAIPSGAALAASQVVDMDLLLYPTAITQVFDFVGANRIQLLAGTVYAVGVELTTVSSGSFAIGLDSTSPTHGGNYSSWGGSSWSAFANLDFVFSVSTASAELFAPTVTPGGGAGAQAVTTTALASTAVVYVPTVSPQAVTVTGVTLASTAVLQVPTVAIAAAADQVVTTAALAAGATVTVPTVTPGAVTITGATRASSVGIFTPSLAAVVTTATCASTAAVAVPALAYALTTATRATGTQVFAPTLTPSVLLPTITSTATLFAPTVVPTQLIMAATCVATSTLFAPTVTTAGALIGGTIAIGSVLFAPALADLVRARHFGYIMTTS